jgi:putative hydrolase of the HAD superfamily
MLNDIYPARKAGFKTALFAGDQRSLRMRSDDPRCRDLTPDLVVTDLGQLIAVIGASLRMT